MQKVTLENIFINANKKSYSFSKFSVSKENVEKVVNPPQNPTVRNNLNKGEINSFSLNPNMIIPIKRQPRKLTAKVPYGNEEGRNL